MHVLVAANNLYPDPQATGSGRYNYEVGRRLAERGHRVSVLTRQRGETPTRGTVAGMDVYRYRASIPRLRRTFRAIRKHVAAANANEPIDLLSLHGALSSVGVDRAVAADRPRIYTLHGLWAAEYDQRASDATLSAPWNWLNRRLRHRIEGATIAHSDRVVVLSEYMRERLEHAHPDASPSVVIPGGADIGRFRPEAAGDADVFDADGTAFLTVRRLTPRMGLETLLEAFASVVERAPDAHLYIGGDGPLRDALRSRAERLGIAPNVTFLGYVPEADLAAAYAGADVFVLPTLELEGFGLVTVEALASGTPVIGTRAGATPEILGGLETHPDVPEPLLVTPGDTDELAARMLAWHALSESVQTAAGEACRDYVLEAGYTWTAVTGRVEALFKRHTT